MTAKHALSLFDSNEDMTAALVTSARRAFNAGQRQTLLLSGGSSPCDFYAALGQEDLPTSERSVFYENVSYTDKVYNKAIDDMIKDIDR